MSEYNEIFTNQLTISNFIHNFRSSLILQKDYEYDEETRKIKLTFKDFYEDFCGNDVYYYYEEKLPGENIRHAPTIGENFKRAIDEKDVPKAYHISACEKDGRLSVIRLDGIETTRNIPNIALSLKNKEKLRELAKHKSKDVRASVARNKNTPDDTIIELVYDEKPEVRAEAINKKCVSTEILKEFSNDPYWFVIYHILTNPNCTQDIIRSHKDNKEWAVRELVARRTTEKEVLNSLSKDNSYRVLYAILDNENITPDIIKNMYEAANKKDRELIEKIKNHPKTPDTVVADIEISRKNIGKKKRKRAC